MESSHEYIYTNELNSKPITCIENWILYVYISIVFSHVLLIRQLQAVVAVVGVAVLVVCSSSLLSSFWLWLSLLAIALHRSNVSVLP